MPRIFKRYCDWCGVYYEKQNIRYCSTICRAAATSGENNWRWNAGQKKCKQCGKLFNPLRDSRKKFGARGKLYCSKKCYSIAGSPKKGKRYIKKIKCKWCKKEFYPWEKKTMFCTRHCFMKHRMNN